MPSETDGLLLLYISTDSAALLVEISPDRFCRPVDTGEPGCYDRDSKVDFCALSAV